MAKDNEMTHCGQHCAINEQEWPPLEAIMCIMRRSHIYDTDKG